MFTVCPKCTLTLVVTTVDLRAGQGYVRCGRCANVFNALIALREGDPASGVADTANRRLLETAPREPIEPAVGSGVAMDPEPEPEPEPDADPAALLAAGAPLDIDLSGEVEAAVEIDAEMAVEEQSLEFDASATDVSDIFIAPQGSEHDTGSGSYEAVVLGDELAQPQPGEPQPELEAVELAAPEKSYTDTIAADDWSLLDEDLQQPESFDGGATFDGTGLRDAAEEAIAAEPEDTAESAAAAGDPQWIEEMFAEAEATAETRRPLFDEEPAPEIIDAQAETAPELAEEAPVANEDVDPLLLPVPPRRRSWQIVSAVALLVFLLVLQVLHHNRSDLALNPVLGPMASRVYGWFGATLAPRWDLMAYSVTQLGAEAEGGEGTRLRVRLSVQNNSERVQPLPLLRLTLQDRFGNAVATRDLTPTEYLPPRAADQRLLEPDQRIDAELHVIDPGKAAIGFEIDACLRGPTGGIGCANDARRRAPG